MRLYAPPEMIMPLSPAFVIKRPLMTQWLPVRLIPLFPVAVPEKSNRGDSPGHARKWIFFSDVPLCFR